MSIRLAVAFVCTALVSAGLGAWLGSAGPASPVTPVRPSPAVASPAAQPALPAIVVASDGTVTLHVDQQPLDWVLEQIAMQAGLENRGLGLAPAVTSASASATALAGAAGSAVPADAARTEVVAADVPAGGDSDPVQSLLQAAAAGADDEATLRWAYQTDASDAVRLIAFESSLGPLSGDRTALRNALEAAQYVPNAAIQAEARRRLDELNESERHDASAE